MEVDQPPLATHLIYRNHDDGDYTDEGVCCFCGVEDVGEGVDGATSKKYFSDDPLLVTPNSDHVCQSCAWTMDQRAYKQGHWIAHRDGIETPSTGDLLDEFRELRAGEYDPPVAVHVTSSPIRSSHSYLWTPVNVSEIPLEVAYDRQKIRIESWDRFDGLVAAVEDLRLHGFTFDEIRSGEPRTQNVASIGIDHYRRLDSIIDTHRRTARLELALTLSRGADDQPRFELTDDHEPLKYGTDEH